jgi:hypothetical protein
MARRRRTAADYARRGPAREPYDLVLIVCEGAKTEPFYFDGLRVAERLSSANIKVTPADGSDPMSIVQYAERFIDAYDRVFCVFDRDGHANYDVALQRIAQSPYAQSKRLLAIPSWPCFELWMLLHFRYSSGAIVGRKATYNELLPRRASAMTHAIRLQKENARTGANNPSTRVHELIDYLLNLR